MSWRVRGGLVMYRFRGGLLEVFLAHPGRPPSKPEGEAEWVIPKGGRKPLESLLQAAQREFVEEVGIRPAGPFIDLGIIEQDNGKIVHAWAFQGEYEDHTPIRSQLIEVEWPLLSGRFHTIPEFDQACFFNLPEAREKMRKSQRPLLDRLPAALGLVPVRRPSF
jgi:predicted NUDIX family NTP pyrophosphohydrolase